MLTVKIQISVGGNFEKFWKMRLPAVDIQPLREKKQRIPPSGGLQHCQRNAELMRNYYSEINHFARKLNWIKFFKHFPEQFSSPATKIDTKTAKIMTITSTLSLIDLNNCSSVTVYWSAGEQLNKSFEKLVTFRTVTPNWTCFHSFDASMTATILLTLSIFV